MHFLGILAAGTNRTIRKQQQPPRVKRADRPSTSQQQEELPDTDTSEEEYTDDSESDEDEMLDLRTLSEVSSLDHLVAIVLC